MNPLEVVTKKLLLLTDIDFRRVSFSPLSVSSTLNTVYLYLQSPNKKNIMVAQSHDGFNFEASRKSIDMNMVSAMNVTNEKRNRLIVYKNGLNQNLQVATFKNSTKEQVHEIPFTKEVGTIIADYRYKDQYVMLYGNRQVNIAFSHDLYTWDSYAKPIIADAKPTQISNAFLFENTVVVVYFTKELINKKTNYQAHIALLDKHHPSHVLWKTERPVWDQKEMWPNTEIKPVGTIAFQDRIISYWQVQGILYGTILISSRSALDLEKINKRVWLQKHQANPILAPQGHNSWEAFNTFNPAAVEAGDKIHILYRAQGFDYVSTIGYANSLDGIHIDERLNQPIYTPQDEFEHNKKNGANYDFMSGGGYGGCEDPRITIVGDRLYMIYVAFDGWSPPRLAMTSILVNDFLHKKWLWTKPVLISRPGIVDKSGCILPEKIRGKYVFFHRVFPNILIDYVDNLNFDGKTTWLKGEYSIKVRPNKWDSRKIGTGAPPLRIDDGWLLIYYGVDNRDASKYHIGAMILDYEHPEKVLYRCDKPILEPTEEYENVGFKPGIAYPCGAVIRDDYLMVYYGGADSVVCIATAPLQTFLKELKSHQPIHFEKIPVQEVLY